MPEYATHPGTISGTRDGGAEVTAHQTAGLLRRDTPFAQRDINREVNGIEIRARRAVCSTEHRPDRWSHPVHRPIK